MTDPEITAPSSVDHEREPVVDFALLGRRLRRTASILGVLVVVAWLVTIPADGVSLTRLMNLVGLALAVMFVAEVIIVGGSAVRGMLRAGERGDRLASDGVSILPPQMTRPRGATPKLINRDDEPPQTS